jgi:RNA polymerase sigma-32 factor
MAAKSGGIVSIPSSGGEAGLNRYLAEIKKFPILAPEEEYMLAKRWREHEDTEAAAKLVNSHLRLVAKIAMGYRGYGLPVSELISEGNIGLMQGVKKFEPDRGFRLATYAMWWIRASIQEFILRSWSLVKMGTTAAQKKLFFNLRRMKNQIEAFEEGDLKPQDVTKIATDLGVTEDEVVSMNRRMAMGGDTSLNVTMKGDEGGESQWQDFLVDSGPLQDERVADAEESQIRHELLVDAMDSLNDREKHILTERRLTDDPKTLEELSQVYGVSRERIRQIEVRAFEKLQVGADQACRRKEAASGGLGSFEWPGLNPVAPSCLYPSRWERRDSPRPLTARPSGPARHPRPHGRPPRRRACPSAAGAPVVLSRAVWCSISLLSSAPKISA